MQASSPRVETEICATNMVIMENMILKVQKYRLSYDPTAERYKDAQKKQDEWKLVGSKVDMSGNYCGVHKSPKYMCSIVNMWSI